MRIASQIKIGSRNGLAASGNTSLHGTQLNSKMCICKMHTIIKGVLNPCRVYLTILTYNIYNQNIDLISWNMFKTC